MIHQFTFGPCIDLLQSLCSLSSKGRRSNPEISHSFIEVYSLMHLPMNFSANPRWRKAERFREMTGILLCSHRIGACANFEHSVFCTRLSGVFRLFPRDPE